MITKEEIQRIKNIQGSARGQTIKNALQSIVIMEGEGGLQKLREKMQELGLWTEEFEKVKIFDWYPLWQDVLLIVVATDFFGWTEGDLKKFGNYNQRVSFFEKTLLRYFLSLETVFNVAPERWKRHYNVGELEPTDFNEEGKFSVIRLRDFSPHSCFCPLLAGYFESATNFVVRSKGVEAIEKKCTFKGDPYHEYLITWH